MKFIAKSCTIYSTKVKTARPLVNFWTNLGTSFKYEFEF